MTPKQRRQWFADARLGMFCHYGLYSVLGRGEWTRNREVIGHDEYAKLANRLATRFDADELTQLAVDLGAKYLTFTTKHHDGYCLFDSKLTDFTSVNLGPKRDLVREVIESCRKRGLKVSLYFSQNDWDHKPDAADALEDKAAHKVFIEYVHGQIRELLTNYGKIDVLWLDGWWPFDADGWQAKKMNAMARRLQPNILINDRNCLPNDFGTIEQHLDVPTRDVWEACFTLNDHWSWHPNDHNWKPPHQVVDMLLQCARAGGNLLINVGPRGDGSIPAPSKRILSEVGAWVNTNEEALRPGLIKPGMDWNHAAGHNFTAKRGVVYMHITAWPGETMTICGVRGKVTKARIVGGKAVKFEQSGDRLTLRNLPPSAPSKLATVIALEHEGKLTSYQTGGMRVPRVKHGRYDPL